VIPALFAFALTLCALLFVYWLFVLKPEQSTADTLNRRLKGTPAPKLAGRPTILRREAQELSSLAVLDTFLNRVLGLSQPLSDLIYQAGVKMTVGTLLLMSGCLTLVGFLIGSLVLRYTIAGVLLAPIFGATPFMFLQWKRKRRILQFEEQFPEALDLLARSLRAGHALTTGIALVAEEMPAPVGPEFRLLYDRQNFGMPFPDALRDFGERIPVLDAKFFTTAVLIQREAGGNLSEVLGNLSSVIRERFRVKRQVRVLSAHGRITGWVLSGLPPALALAFMFSSEEHIQTLVTDPLGRQMVLVAVCLQVTGTLIIRKLVQIEY
jgi:tight adherence protein B